MSNLLGSKIVRRAIWVLGGLIALCLVFGAGIAVGYHRAGFTAGFAANYARNFYGVPAAAGPMAIMKGVMPGAPVVVIHGIAGTVIDVGSSTIAVVDGQKDEQSIAVSSATIIREGGGAATIADIAAGDRIATIGSPNADGQIEARFIRIFPASSTAPQFQ